MTNIKVDEEVFCIAQCAKHIVLICQKQVTMGLYNSSFEFSVQLSAL